MEDGRLLPDVSETFSYGLLGRADVRCEDAQVVDDDDDLDATELCTKYYPDDDEDVA